MVPLHRAPPAAVPVFALGVGALHVEVLRVAVEGGVTPGDVVVVAGDDYGHPGKADARGVEVRGTKVHFVPDTGDGVVEVHVVREQRAPGSGVGAADDPLVRTWD